QPSKPAITEPTIAASFSATSTALCSDSPARRRFATVSVGLGAASASRHNRRSASSSSGLHRRTASEPNVRCVLVTPFPESPAVSSMLACTPHPRRRDGIRAFRSAPPRHGCPPLRLGRYEWHLSLPRRAAQ